MGPVFVDKFSNLLFIFQINGGSRIRQSNEFRAASLEPVVAMQLQGSACCGLRVCGEKFFVTFAS